jgi:hypothetical protein
LTVDLDGLKVGGTPDTRQLWKPGTLRKGWAMDMRDWKTTNVGNVGHIIEKPAEKLAEWSDGIEVCNQFWKYDLVAQHPEWHGQFDLAMAIESAATQHHAATSSSSSRRYAGERHKICT